MKIIAGLSRHGDRARLGVVLQLTVAATLSHNLPAVGP